MSSKPTRDLGAVLNAMIEEAVANGWSRRAARRMVAKTAENMWRAGKIELYGVRDGTDHLELIPRDPDLELVHVPRQKRKIQ